MNYAEPASLLEEIQALRENCDAMGILKRTKEFLYRPLKIVFEPFESTRTFYTHLSKLETIWQKLFWLVSKDDQLITRVYQQIVTVDPNIARKMQIYQRRKVQQDMITVVRCDYFVNDCGSAKLIEYNLMSVSLTSHSGNIQRAKALTDQTRKDSYIEDDANDLFVRIVSDFYTEKKMSGLFLFVVLQSESNIVDQRLIEAGLLKAEIKCSRATLSQLAKYGKIDQHNDLLYGQSLISIVYYRSSYDICHFTQDCQQDLERCWVAKELIELSNAVKIPNITMELINEKRMQAELSKASIIQKYLTPQQATILIDSVAGTWEFDTMDQPTFEALLASVKSSSNGFVLKPNREGGGHNIFGDQVFKTLKELSAQERKKYTLMEKIETPALANIIIDGNTYRKANCVSEVSRYGVISSINGEVRHNTVGGFLVRVKSEQDNEGGVIAGTGAISAWRICEEKAL